MRSLNMKVCTLTSHDVYNHGAILQAYALMKYLSNCGHDVEIIDYKTAYLKDVYHLFNIHNPAWDKNPITRFIYLSIKIPSRLSHLKRKKAFERFKDSFLRVTSHRYASNDELKANIPEADAYI